MLLVGAGFVYGAFSSSTPWDAALHAFSYAYDVLPRIHGALSDTFNLAPAWRSGLWLMLFAIIAPAAALIGAGAALGSLANLMFAVFLKAQQ